MACDPNTLLAQARCYQCLLTGDLFPAVEIVLLCAWRDRTVLACDPQTLVAQASCIRSCIPYGMMPAVKAALLCDIASGGCSTPAAPTGLGATAPAPETTVSWTDNATNETAYQIRYQNITQGGGFTSPVSLPVNSTGTVIVITGAANGDSIEIQVRSVNGVCVSAWVSITVVAIINN
jgi:hypothetical protein